MRRFLSFLLLSFISQSAFSDWYSHYHLRPTWYSSASPACSTLAPYISASITGIEVVNGSQCKFTYNNNPNSTATYGLQVSTCNGIPTGSSYDSNYVCNPCPAGQVLNPGLGTCQAPCVAEDEPDPGGSFTLSLGADTYDYCNAACITRSKLWVGTDSDGFSIYTRVDWRPGVMCSVGDPNTPPPPPPPRDCPSPSVVRSDGSCGTPDPSCKSWQTLQNHQCVNQECDAGKTLKCGTVDGEQACACAGPTDCEPGTAKNAFGNCVPTQPCGAGEKVDPVTAKCVPDDTNEADCPTGTHREGLICVKDPGDCQPGTWFVPGCGCISDVNQCVNRSSNDIDGDGTPNNQDNDADGDGIHNRADPDADNDGIPNNIDSSPMGPGSAPMAPDDTSQTDPNGDLDGDGIPNSQDDDRDGDGVINGNDTTPDGGPANDPSKTRDTSKSDPDGDLDGDGVPNSQDGDRDGDGIPNGDDATPDGRGDGTGVNDGQCDPETEECGEGKDKPGKPAALDDRFYEKKQDRDFLTIWTAFISRVQSARLITAGSRFFSAGISGGSCPTWQIPSTFVSPAIPITLQCSSEVLSALRVAGVIVLIIAAWLAFRIALL